jgi:hypothetical protein
VSEPENAFGRRAGSAEGSSSGPVPERAVYEPPRLRALGTLGQLTQGVAG